MDRKSRRRQNTSRRFELPSGKVIEVFAAAGSASTMSAVDGDEGHVPMGRRLEAARERDPDGPHRCSRCGSELVYPVAWRSAPTGGWEVDLRCPNCERGETLELEQTAAERFDEQLEHGADRLKQDLAGLTKANMADQLARFIAALEADAIQPSDL